MTEELNKTVTRHDRELIEIRSELGVLTTGMAGLTKSVDAIASKLSGIADDVRHRDHTSVKDINGYLQIATYATVLIAAIVSGIVYIAGNSNQVDLALIKYRVDRLHGSFGWEPSIKRSEPQK